MKRTITILLLSIYLLGTTEAYQLLKLPLLVEHYLQHRAENKHITLIQFLKIHYTEPVVFDDDYAQDMQLPFKTHEANMCFVPISPILFDKIEVKAPDFFVVKDTHKPSNDHQYISILQEDIFQPPKA